MALVQGRRPHARRVQMRSSTASTPWLRASPPASGPAASDEDVHTLIDRLLHDEIGDVASKLHTGRSRNDQVATATRLWSMDAATRLDAAVRGLQQAMIDQAHGLETALMPSYTHLQRAIPVSAAHWLLVAFLAARARSRAAARRAARCGRPSARLGRGRRMRVSRVARAASGKPRLRRHLAEFDRRGERSRFRRRVVVHRRDDRDAPVAIRRRPDHLRFERVRVRAVRRRLYVRIEHDAAEAESRRAGAGPWVGGAHARRPRRRCSARSRACRAATTRICRTTSAYCSTRSTRCCSCCRRVAARSPSASSSRSACVRRSSSTMMATDLADYLVRKGATFREAHGAVGRLVRQCEEERLELHTLPLAAFDLGTPAVRARRLRRAVRPCSPWSIARWTEGRALARCARSSRPRSAPWNRESPVGDQTHHIG